MIGFSKDISNFYGHLSCVFLFCILFSVTGYSQSMSVASFKLDEKDLTANTHGTMKSDLNGDKCAIIKIETTERNFTFDVGSIGITEVVNQNAEHPSEIWLYVPHGVKSISIQHPTLGTIRDYDLGLRLKKGKTYILKLTTDQVNTLVVDYNNSQYLVLDVFPKNAEVFFNGILFKLNENGKQEIPLSFGTHNYRITAHDYHSTEGQVVIKDKENKQNLSIRLKQAFGYVSVNSPSSEFDGANIFIDGVSVGKLPLDKIPLKSGIHKLTISKELYNPYSESFAVTDSSFVSLTPTFEPNFANVTISTDGDAQIFDNGNLLGKGKWQGRLEAGSHIIEVKKISHRTISKKVSFVNGEKRNISIESPTPIYGSIEITSTPSEAEVYVDGMKMGKTPFISSRLLVGEHKIELRKKGYKTETEVLNIDENKTIRLSKELADFCDAELNANVYADVYIDGIKKGGTPYNLHLVAGTYTIELKSKGYSLYSKKLKLDGSTEDMYVKLRRNFVRNSEFYMQTGYNPLGIHSWSVGVGFYIKRVNLELNYISGISESENIYISDGYSMPEPATYKPNGFNVKLGYGLRCTSRLRITPQVAIQLIHLKEDLDIIYYIVDDYNDYEHYCYYSFADKANTLSTTFGARISFAALSWLGLSVTPEYALPIYKSKGYKTLSGVSSDIDNWNKGFNCCINMNVFF